MLPLTLLSCTGISLERHSVIGNSAFLHKLWFLKNNRPCGIRLRNHAIILRWSLRWLQAEIPLRTPVNFFHPIHMHLRFNAFDCARRRFRSPVLQRSPLVVTSLLEAIKTRPIRQPYDFFRPLPSASTSRLSRNTAAALPPTARPHSWKDRPKLGAESDDATYALDRVTRRTATPIAQFEDAFVKLFAVAGILPARGTPSVGRSTTARERERDLKSSYNTCVDWSRKRVFNCRLCCGSLIDQTQVAKCANVANPTWTVGQHEILRLTANYCDVVVGPFANCSAISDHQINDKVREAVTELICGISY